jgi:hypothetical protein
MAGFSEHAARRQIGHHSGFSRWMGQQARSFTGSPESLDLWQAQGAP